MTTQKSSTLLTTTVSTLFNRAFGVISRWSPILAISAMGAITLHEWQHNSVFRSRITSTAAVAVKLVQATELCRLHKGNVLLFGTEPQNYVANGGVKCGFQTREGVISLLNEYDAMGQLVLFRIAPYGKSMN